MTGSEKDREKERELYERRPPSPYSIYNACALPRPHPGVRTVVHTCGYARLHKHVGCITYFVARSIYLFISRCPFLSISASHSWVYACSLSVRTSLLLPRLCMRIARAWIRNEGITACVCFRSLGGEI